MQRRPLPQRRTHLLRLSRIELIARRRRNPRRHLDATGQVRNAIRTHRLQKIVRRLDLERPKSLLHAPAQSARLLRIPQRAGEDRIELRFLPRAIERFERGGQLVDEGGVGLVDAAVEEQSPDARLEGGGACGEVAAERVAQQREAGDVDVGAGVEVVDDGCDGALPVRDEADVLVASDAGLAGAFVGDDVPAAGEGGKDEEMHQFFLGGVVSVAHDDGGSLHVWARIFWGVEDGFNVKSVRWERETLTGYGKGCYCVVVAFGL